MQAAFQGMHPPALGFAHQTKALLIKNMNQQRRSILSNLCLLSVPVLFGMALWLLQNIVTSLISSSTDFQVHIKSGALKKLP